MPKSRHCTKCGIEKSLDQFSAAPNGKYGVKSNCKACDAARYKRNHVPKPRTKRREPFSGDEPKRCTKCGQVKRIADFSLSRRATATQNAVYRSHCKPCWSAQAVQWYRDNPGRTIANRRRLTLTKLYGLTQDDYDRMVRQQGGVCAICLRGGTSRRERLAVDHCHKTGRVRGLLCDRCNRSIGLLGDDPIVLRRAISYLLRRDAEGVRQGGQ